MQDLNNMAIFAKVAECQGISAAARMLQMPKSKVSRRMAALEEALGVRLLERSTRAVRLTEIGEIYFHHCKRVVEEAASARESINHMLEVPRGHLRISASVGIGQHLLAPLLGRFLTRYPEIDLDLRLENRRVDLIREGYDAVVRVGRLEDSAYISKSLGKDHAFLVASPSYLQDAGIPKNLDDFTHHRFLAMGDASSLVQKTLIGPGGKKKTLPVGRIAWLNDLTVIRQVALDGGGIALLPRFMCRAFLGGEGGLVSVLPEWRSTSSPFYALYPSRKSMTLKLGVWLDHLKAGLEGFWDEY